MTRMLLFAVVASTAVSASTEAACSEQHRLATNRFEIVIQSGSDEPASTGTYSVRITDRNDTCVFAKLIAERDGSIAKVWLSHLDEQSNSIDVVVWCISAGSGSYGSVDLYSIDRCGRIHQTELEELTAVDGYMGHDRFFIDDYRLFREFPLYRPGDSNSSPTGGRAVFALDYAASEWRKVNHPARDVEP